MGLFRKLLGPASDASAATTFPVERRANASAVTARGQALARVCAALEAAPDDPRLLYERADILFAWGRYREAQDGYVRAAACGQRGPEFDVQLGLAYLRNGHVAKAEAQMSNAIAAEPGSAIAHFELAMVLRAFGRLSDAISSFEHSAQIGSAHFETLLELGNCKVELGDPAAGEALFRRAIAADGERAVGWQNLGVALRRQDRHDEALDAFEHAEKLEWRNGPEFDSFVNLAIELTAHGRTEEALAVYERWLPRRPAVQGHHAYAEALLAAGRFAEGWRHFEFRWLNEPLLSNRYASPRPAWTGQDLRGKSIRLRIEQGLGDIIQFVRYAPMLKALGATVQLSKFDDIATHISGIDCVTNSAEPPQPFDYYVNVMSLPRHFGTEMGSIPSAVPYIAAASEKVAQWRSRVNADAETLKVGIVWAGNASHPRDRHRSLALQTLAPLGRIAGVKWFSLQKVARSGDEAAPPPGFEWVDLGPELCDMSDTAAVIGHLDLVVCVDTAVAHLAGAMGAPVWTLIAQPSDWRWLEARDDSPWYPTMRLFRQRSRGNWNEVIERVGAALESLVAERRDVARWHFRTPPAPAAATSASSALATPAGNVAGLSAVTETRHGILQYLPDEPVVGASIDHYGEYLEPELTLLSRMLRPGATVLETGAGVGAHSLFLATTVGPAGHLILSEPRSVNQQILGQNLMANAITNATLLSLVPAAPDGAAASESVDDLQLERLDWLKVSESDRAAEILDGAATTLWRLRPMLFVAATDELALARIADAVKAFGYRAWRMSAPMFNPDNFNRRVDDIFSGRSALAVLAFPEEIEVNVAIDGCVEL
jgi:tetratricopeptide (TPR) repeat protein/precorrin-6B methylase 2